MNKTVAIALVACLSLALLFIVGCAPDDPSDEYAEAAAQQPSAEDIKRERLERFVYNENQMFAGMDEDFCGKVTSDGTTIKYSYTFCLDTVNTDLLPAVFENMSQEGPTLLYFAQEYVPEITTVAIEFHDTEGNVLHSKQFE